MGQFPSADFSNVPVGSAVMLYFPAHGGWHRCIVNPGMNRFNTRPVQMSAMLRGQLSMHQNLNTGHATHWRDLPPDPINAETAAQYASILHFVHNKGLIMGQDGNMRLFSRPEGGRQIRFAMDEPYDTLLVKLHAWAAGKDQGKLPLK